MSAVLGLWGTPPFYSIERAADRLRHWGPDLFDQQSDAQWTLMQFSSTITPESTFEQIQKLPGGQWLVADAILDNRPELIQDLGIEASIALNLPDSGLIACAWSQWGDECLSRLIGDFAFAVVDPSDGSLFLARDHIGTRPLVFMVRPHGRAFGSSGDAVLDLLGETPDPDLSRISEFLEDPGKVHLQSLLKNVCDVLPGQAVRVSANGALTTRQWWNPWAIQRRPALPKEEIIATFRSLTERAVADRVRTAKPIGTHVSGGIDSTVVTLIAAQTAARAGRSIKAAFAWAPDFSAQYPDQGTADERHRILRECAKVSLPVSFSREGVQHLLHLVKRRLEFEGPVNIADEFSVLERAQKLGIRVILSGWGGDEAFSAHGFGMLPYMLRRGHWRFVLNALRRQAGGLRQIRSFTKLLWSELILPFMPDRIWRVLRPKDTLYRHSCFRTPELAEKSTRKSWSRLPELRLVSDPIEFLRRAIANGHIGERMKAWAHWGSEAGLQYRYPLTDRRLIEFVLSLPPESLFIGGHSRSLPKMAFADIWPEGSGKNDPANELRRRDERRAFQSTIADRLKNNSRKKNPWIDIDALRLSIDQPLDANETEDVSRFAEALHAWRILEFYDRLGLWLIPQMSPDCAEKIGVDPRRV